MKRHYYLSDNLDALQKVEEELEQNGVIKPQIHVLSKNDQGVAEHNLHMVEAVLKRDVVYKMEIGAVFGVVGALLVLAVSHFSGATAAVGWVPFIFLAIVVLGFCTWEGGFLGIQEVHHDFKRFEHDLDRGRHVLFVDIDPNQEAVLERIVASSPSLQKAGYGEATPRWVIMWQKNWTRFMDAMP